MTHTIKEKKKLLARVGRIRGQVEALERALSEETECGRIMHMIAGIRGSVAGLMRERNRREQVFDREQDSSLTQNCDWLNRRRQMVRQVLGFSIGGEPVLPPHLPTTTAAAVATATGPPSPQLP